MTAPSEHRATRIGLPAFALGMNAGIEPVLRCSDCATPLLTEHDMYGRRWRIDTLELIAALAGHAAACPGPNTSPLPVIEGIDHGGH